MTIVSLLLTALLASAQTPTPTPSPTPGPRVYGRKLLLSTLLSSLQDKDESIRAKAAEDIGKLQPPAVDAVNPLIAALKDKAPIVRYRSAEALEKIGTPKARRAVFKFRKKLGREKFSW